MKIAYLSAGNAIHTVRWVNALAQRGHTIFLITMHKGNEPLHEKVSLFQLPVTAPLGYFFNASHLKNLLKRLQPDFLHVHYATGYGTLGRLCQFKPMILSVWGSDIFDFPVKSFLHRAWLVKNLKTATKICSTSHVMATATEELLRRDNQPIAITPFGIDTMLFYPQPELRDSTVFKIGTVKTLASKYGIDTLIQAFYTLRNTLAGTSLAQQLRLCIAGDGPQRDKLQALVAKLGLSAVTEFAGHLPHAQVPAYLNQLNIYVACSRLDSESFGVAILEASACGLPVIVSRVGGLPEVVEEGVTGLIVEKEDIEQFATALSKLVQNKTIRDTMGHAGRQHVMEKYNWQESVPILETVYKQIKAMYRCSEK